MFGPDRAQEASRGKREALPIGSPARQPKQQPRREGAGRAAVVQGQSAAKTVAVGAMGVAMRCLERRAGLLFQVVLLQPEREADILFEAKDDRDIVAVWRSISEDLGLPAVVLNLHGEVLAFNAMLGRLSIGAVRPRRRTAALAKRHPRALMRRRVGRLPPRPSVHREREIIAHGE